MPFFLRWVISKDYAHLPQLVPTADMLRAYRDNKGDWTAYERDFLALMKQRRVEETLSMALLDGGYLLCSEATPENCRQRLVAAHAGLPSGFRMAGRRASPSARPTARPGSVAIKALLGQQPT